jgi:hypothetical protein
MDAIVISSVEVGQNCIHAFEDQRRRHDKGIAQ